MKKKQVFVGSVFHYAVLVSALVSGLITTPFIISRLGYGIYGVYKIVISIIAYVGVLNFGFGNTVIRYLTEIINKNDIKKEKEFLSVIKTFNLISVVIAAISGVVLYAVVPFAFSHSLTPYEISIAQQMLLVLIVSVVINIFNEIYIGIITAHERFIFLRGFDFLRSIIRFVLIMAILTLHPSAIFLVTVDLFLSGVMFIINLSYSRFKLNTQPKFSFSKIKSLDMGYYKPVFIYTAYLFLNLILGQLTFNTNLIIIGMRLSSFDASVYAASTVISHAFFIVSLVIGNNMFPSIVKAVTGGANNREITDIMARIGRLHAYVGMFILTAFFAFGRQFIVLWLGPDFSEVWIAALLIMCGTMFNSLTAAGHLILRAMNKQDFYLISYAGIFVLNAVVAYFIAPVYGITGVAFTTFLSFAVVFCFAILPYKHRLGMNMFVFLKRICLPVVVPSVLAVVSFFVFEFLSLDSWATVFAAGFCYALVFCLLIYFVAMNNNEKAILKNIITRVAS